MKQTVRLSRGAAGLLATAAGMVAVVAVVLLATAAGGSNGSYAVRAIFDDANNLTSGEEVKADGAKIGSVGEVSATRQGKAAVSLHIENPGFQDFREDASCEILPQSLLGEQYVNCRPTQQRPEGAPTPPPLHQIRSGEYSGEFLLPLSNTSSPVGVDQLQDINRLPQAQAFRIILNELGATFAGRGEELHEVIIRADPALRELNKVLHILAGENHVLADLAVESDRALGPLAANRENVAGFIEHGDKLAEATARHLPALEAGLAEFPGFLHQLSPALERVRRLAHQTTPTFEDLEAAAPALDAVFENLAPFDNSTRKYLVSLGSTAKITGPALRGTTQLLDHLRSLGSAAQPLSQNLAKLLESFRKKGGIERLMDFIFLSAGSTNGYDALGHFLRAEPAAIRCINYSIQPTPGCPANFRSTGAARTSSVSGTSVVMARTLAVLEGKTAAQAVAEFPGAEGLSQGGSGSTQPAGKASAGTTYYSPSPEASGASERLLEYLLGS